jgi:hypothetical protein
MRSACSRLALGSRAHVTTRSPLCGRPSFLSACLDMRADHAGTFSKDRPDTPNASIEDLKEELAVLLAAADFSAGSLAAASGVPARR